MFKIHAVLSVDLGHTRKNFSENTRNELVGILEGGSFSLRFVWVGFGGALSRCTIRGDCVEGILRPSTAEAERNCTSCKRK